MIILCGFLDTVCKRVLWTKAENICNENRNSPVSILTRCLIRIPQNWKYSLRCQNRFKYHYHGCKFVYFHYIVKSWKGGEVSTARQVALLCWFSLKINLCINLNRKNSEQESRWKFSIKFISNAKLFFVHASSCCGLLWNKSFFIEFGECWSVLIFIVLCRLKQD